jgi:hypothetical protein
VKAEADAAGRTRGGREGARFSTDWLKGLLGAGELADASPLDDSFALENAQGLRGRRGGVIALDEHKLL